jgi:non-canonical (house-cleaning) NTP pyrophosphatase
VEIGAVVKVFERIYGEENVFARGAMVESGFAKQAIGMRCGMRGAQSKIQNLLTMDSFKDKLDFIFIALESFVEEVDGEWFDFNAVVLFDRKNNITVKGFSQGIPIPSEVAEKVRALTPTEYPFREFGVRYLIFLSFVEKD